MLLPLAGQAGLIDWLQLLFKMQSDWIMPGKSYSHGAAEDKEDRK